MNIKETRELLKTIPIKQAIMLQGIHGIGKSEFLRDFYEKEGYEVHVFFGATAADAGDIIGLPKHETTKVYKYNLQGETIKLSKGIAYKNKDDIVEKELDGEVVKITDEEYLKDLRGNIVKVTRDSITEVEEDILVDSYDRLYTEYAMTSFSPPQWWPKDPKKPVVIFLDEANRAKADIQNCFMDMILNRKLNGRTLPERTRVIAGINPFEEGLYEVNKTDPAFNDRFVIIDFNPTPEEWIDYAYSKGFNPEVIEFITKHTIMLDPDMKSDAMVQPSRRSWERVSDYLNENPNIKQDTFFNYLSSCVGLTAKSTYQSFRTSNKRGLYAKKLLLEFPKEFEVIINKMKVQETCFFNLELYYWFERNIETWYPNNDTSKTIFNNLYKYLELITDELAVQFLSKICDQFGVKGITMLERVKDGKKVMVEWPEVFQYKHPNFNATLARTIRGSDE